MCGAIAALYIRKRRPTTTHVRMVTAIGAPAAISCAARICAAPENMSADNPSASQGEAPADCAPTPQTRPNGTRPMSGGVMSRTPATKSGREKIAGHERRDQPLTPPAVSPPTTRSWKSAISSEIGTMATMSAAEMSGHGNANSPW